MDANDDNEGDMMIYHRPSIPNLAEACYTIKIVDHR